LVLPAEHLGYFYIHHGQKAEARRKNLQDLILDGTISSQDYQDMKEKIDKDLVLFKSKLSGLMDQSSPYKTYISKTIPMLENLTGYYKAADGQTKKKILGCIFSEKLVFEKGPPTLPPSLKLRRSKKASEDNRRVATTPFTEPIQVLFKIAKVLQGCKNKKEVENNLLSTLAPLTAESCNWMKDLLIIKSGYLNSNFDLIGYREADNLSRSVP
jgi:site-specific DNA recombinase